MSLLLFLLRNHCESLRNVGTNKRVIPCLDVDQGRVVKGTRFVGLRDAGNPVKS